MLYDSDGNVCACTVQFRPKHFREIFYPALYAETGEGDLEDDADAVAPPPPPAILSDDYDEIGGGGGDTTAGRGASPCGTSRGAGADIIR